MRKFVCHVGDHQGFSFTDMTEITALDTHTRLMVPRYAWLENAAYLGGCGAVSGVCIAVYQGRSTVLTALSMGTTWSATGLLFFGVRQIFQTSLMADLGLQLSERKIRYDRDAFISSMCAGAITGGLLGTFYSGVRASGSSVALYTLAASIAQLVYTSTRHLRQDTLLWYLRQTKSLNQPLPAGSTIESAVAAAETEVSERNPLWHSYQTAAQRWLYQLPRWSPVRMISDAEYVVTLERKLRDNEAELRKYEEAVQRLEARKVVLQQEMDASK